MTVTTKRKPGRPKGSKDSKPRGPYTEEPRRNVVNLNLTDAEFDKLVKRANRYAEPPALAVLARRLMLEGLGR